MNDQSEKIICENFTPENYDSTHYKFVYNQIEAKEILDTILTKQKIGFSLSTDTLNAIDAKITGISIATAPGEAFFIACLIKNLPPKTMYIVVI